MLVIDAAHDADAIARAVGDRRLVAVVCTHAHDDHVNAAPELGMAFSGDTLFAGGPGATGRSFSDPDTIVDSIRARLLTLPESTEVRTGHGDSTTIGTEAPQFR